MVMNPMVESIKNHLKQTHVESGKVNFHDFPCKGGEVGRHSATFLVETFWEVEQVEVGEGR